MSIRKLQNDIFENHKIKNNYSRMNTAIGSVSALLSQNKINRSEDAEDIPQGVLLLGDSMVRNIRPEYIPDAMVIKFAYPGITGKQLQNQFKELFLNLSLTQF